LFWFVVSALSIGTALVTMHQFSPAAHGKALRPPDREATTVDRSTDLPASREPATRMPRPPTSERVSPPPAERVSPPTSASVIAARARLDREEVRQALARLVRTTRQRLAADAGPPEPALDEAGHMPRGAMSFEQYRTWVKFAHALAARDYRAVEHTLDKAEASYDESIRQALIDALAHDYRTYLSEVIEGECEGLEPQSLWRKTVFMALLLTRLERQSPEISELEQQARFACGF